MMEEKGKKGKNEKFWCKSQKVAAIIWGKEGMWNGKSFIVIMFLFGKGTQHILLYEKMMVIQLGDGL